MIRSDSASRLMFQPADSARSTASRTKWRRLLLAGASATALLIVPHAAVARSLQDSGSSAAAAAAAVAAAQASAQQAAATASQAMIRAASSMQGMRNIQAAARAAALSAAGAVPNGLTPGGLVTAKGAVSTATDFGSGLWQGAKLPTQAVSAGRTQVEITQTEAKAILTWDSFNVGRETDLYFNQTAGGTNVANWIALNRVLDPSAAPSRILGTIKAEGQVYVINKNGIVFGGSSQVNVHTLIASSLSLSNAQFKAGINVGLKVPDPNGSGADWSIANFGDSPTETSETTIINYATPPGTVTVDAGAIIESQNGGKAMLFAPHVVNAGTIRTPGGQTIMAAGEYVWLGDPVNTDPLSTVRGLDVAVSSPTSFLLRWNTLVGVIYGSFPNQTYDIALKQMDEHAAAVGYSVTNTGVVESARGNITMMARSIAQNGTLLASTALNNQDGSIVLRAWSQGFQTWGGDVTGGLFWWTAGTVALGTGSVTMVVPDLTDTSNIELSNVATRYRPGTIDLRGNLIDIQAGANVVAPSGNIIAIASKQATLGGVEITFGEKPNDGSRIYIGENALISVAGLRDVMLKMESNTVAAELRINELRDSVLYVDSWLRGAVVYVDKRVSGTFADGPMAGVQWIQNADGSFQTGNWMGTSIADVSRWIGTGATNLAELSTAAGTIKMRSGGDMIVRAGALLDVAGGSVRYASGYIATTKLMGANGKIYDIGDATPDQLYVGLPGTFSRVHERIDVTEFWSTKLDRNVSVRFEEGYTEGRAAGSILMLHAAGLAMEGDLDGSVIIGQRQAASGKGAKAGIFQIGGDSLPYFNWSTSNMIITDKPVLLASDFNVTTALSKEFYDKFSVDGRGKTTWLKDDMLSASGMGELRLNYSKSFEVTEDAVLALSPGAALKVGKNVNVSDTSQTAIKIDGTIRIAGGIIDLNSNNFITLGAKAVLDVSGTWINEYASGLPADAPKISGGAIGLNIDPNSVKSSVANEVKITSGATLDISGGGWLSNRGGKQKLQLGDAGSIALTSLASPLSGLDMRAYAAGSGGVLTITMLGDIQIGGTQPINPKTLYLPPTLLADRGFRSVSIITEGNVTVPDGASVNQTPVNIDLVGSNYLTAVSGTRMSEIGRIRVLDLQDRITRKSTGLTVTTPKTVTIGTGATLATDVKGSIVFSQGASITTGIAVINGAIDAPAGTIAIDARTLTFGDKASLTARGVAVTVESPSTGLRTGTVLNGGAITLSGVMTLGPNVLVDVSGTSAVIDDPQRPLGSDATILLASDGGSISIISGQSGPSKIDAKLVGRAGGAGASGGVLTLTDLGLVGSATTALPGVATTSYMGYFTTTPGTGARYSRNAATGEYKVDPAGIYYFTGGLIASSTAANNVDLDIYDEYSATAYKLTAAIRSAINGLPNFVSSTAQIVVGLAADAPPSPDSVLPWVRNPVVTEKAVTLLNKYFYIATRTGTATANYVYTPTTKINIATVIPAVANVISQNSINNGGFGGVTLPGMKLGNGVFLNLPTATVNIAAILALTPGGSARIDAGYLGLGALFPAPTSASANTTPTGGTLSLNAQMFEVGFGFTRGYADTKIVAGDIRLTAPGFGIGSRLDTDGTLTLQAAQIYPSTGTTGLITAANKIVVLQNGEASAPLSAGGNLTLAAPDIDISGTVRVPFGSLTLSATKSITLGAGAVLSVSGDGLVLPYGQVLNGDSWTLPKDPNSTNPGTLMTSPPEKKIVLGAPSVTVAAGSTLDIRGGGDLRASEFVVGSGGSHDLLAMSGVYAILLSSASANAPTGANAAVGSRVWLGGGNGLAAGWYTLLPAQYALLPGAFAVQVVAGTAGKSVVGSLKLPDGTVLMPGRLGNKFDGSVDAQASSWRVMSGNVVRAYSDYNEFTANTFFASEAFKLSQYRLSGLDIVTPRLPMDGGSVVFKATDQLVLDGQLKSAAADGGRAGLVDIAATNIAVVGAGQDRSGLGGYLVIDSARLTSFGAASLLLGGIRTSTTEGLGVEVFASNIVVRNDGSSGLVGPELILAASDNVTIGAGSVVKAEGEIVGGSGNLIVKPQVAAAGDYGAVIRLSNGDVVSVKRTSVDKANPLGTVNIGAGAVLTAGKALLIDATQNAVLANSAQLGAADIALSSGSISFGGGSTGMVFDAASLARFNVAQNLTLRSYTSIDFYTGIDFGSAGLKAVTLDATGLVGRSAGTTTVTGDTVALTNSVGTFIDPLLPAQGALVFNTNQVILGGGPKTLRGFASVTVNAGNNITGQGTGSLDAGTANVRMVSPLITAKNGANQSVTTSGAMAILASGAAAARDAESLGSRWAFNAGSIDFGGRVTAMGGSVSLTAVGGNVTLLDGAMIDVGGGGKTFNDVTAYVNAGTVNLTSVGGSVIAAAGSGMNLSAAAGGGNAGTLSAVASGGGTVVLAGTIDAHAPAGKGGSFTLDIGALPDFAGFSMQLENAGFTRSRQFRIRTGDVILGGVTKVEDFVLSTDAGKVTIVGSIDASAAYGGNIAISGGNGLTMLAGASLTARSTTSQGGGRVMLEATGGTLDISGGTIDVSGGEGGKVRFRAMQNTAHNDVLVSNLAATISGARSAVLEGVWRSTGSVSIIDAALIAQANAAANDFVGNAAAIQARLNTGVAVTSGIDIRSNGDLTLAADWDLSGLATHDGTLTLRAAGNLTVLGNISDGFSDATRTGALLAQKSWDLRLVSGADLGSANALAMTPLAGLPANSGTLTIGSAGNGYLVRTGTGDLAVQAGRDLKLAHYQSTIYTAGKKDTTVFADFVAPTGAVYAIQGGNLDVAAGGSISSTLPTVNENNTLYTDWLKKAGETDGNFTFTTQQATWWIDPSGFAQGVGTLGGGNVNVKAGGDLDNLTVVLADNGRVRGGRTFGEAKFLESRNGGAMDVTVGGAIKAGNYYIARGAGSIDAGTLAIGRTVTSSWDNGHVVTNYNIAPVLALGNAILNVRSAGEMRIQAVLDPLMAYNPKQVAQAYMLGMTDDSRLNLTSVGGDIVLVNQARYVSQNVTTTSFWSDTNNGTKVQFANMYAGNLYPATTSIVALNGSITGLGVISNFDDLLMPMVVLPGIQGGLTMLAAKDIAPGGLLMARAPLAMLPSIFHPVTDVTGGGFRMNGAGFSNRQFYQNLLNAQIDEFTTWAFAYLANPDVLPNIGDMEPSRIYALGNIRGGMVTTSEQTWISGGKDVRDLTLNLRNLHPTDVSRINAGNDILDNNLNFEPSIAIQGPGSLLLTAGRDVYAAAQYILSTGNKTFRLFDMKEQQEKRIKGLPDTGASVEIIAGLQGQEPGYAAVASTYLDPAQVATMPDYLKTTVNGVVVPLYLTDQYEDRHGVTKQIRFGVVSYVKAMTGLTLSPLAAWAKFQTLPVLAQQRFVRQVYMQELRSAGRDENTRDDKDRPLNVGINRGYTAIEALFPGDLWKGDVVNANAKVMTLAGGDITVLAPGGGLQVASLTQNVLAGFGLITLGYGNINIATKQDVVVNRSRILTFAGGDVTIWSTLGDIDAGKGAKTTRVGAAALIETDADGVTRSREKADMSGAGIGTVIGNPGVEPGDLDLYAPKGVIDFSDAGARSSGNASVFALVIRNADNIKSDGDIKGLPKTEAPPVNLSVEVKDKSAADAVKDATQQTAVERPSVIIVEVMGYGGPSGDALSAPVDSVSSPAAGGSSGDPLSTGQKDAAEEELRKRRRR